MSNIVNMLVIRDHLGNVINIGEWDYCQYEEDGVEFIGNPLPENCTSQYEDVQIKEDGSRVAVNQ